MKNVDDRRKLQIILMMGIVVFTITIFSLILAFFKIQPNATHIDRDRYHLTEIFFFGSPLFYFTTLSNLTLGIALIVFGFKNQITQKRNFSFLFLATAWMSITFLVYWLLISWLSLDIWLKDPFISILSILLHGINPITGFVALFLVGKYNRISYKTLWLGTFIFVCYGLMTVFLYFLIYVLKGKPLVFYEFLDYTRPLYYSGNNIFIIILLNVIILSGFFLVPWGCSTLIYRFLKINFQHKKHNKLWFKRFKKKN